MVATETIAHNTNLCAENQAGLKMRFKGYIWRVMSPLTLTILSSKSIFYVVVHVRKIVYSKYFTISLGVFRTILKVKSILSLSICLTFSLFCLIFTFCLDVKHYVFLFLNVEMLGIIPQNHLNYPYLFVVQIGCFLLSCLSNYWLYPLLHLICYYILYFNYCILHYIQCFYVFYLFG